MMSPVSLIIAIRLGIMLIKIINILEKYNEHEGYEMTLEEQVIINNLPKVERIVRELEFDEAFADEHDNIGN